MAVDSVRTVLLAVLAVTVATGTASVPIVYAILFASGVGDTLVMTAGISFVPSLVPRASMTRAYSRIIATRLIGAILLARPIGAWLFTRDASVPFVVDAASFLGGVLLLTRVPSPPPPERADEPRRRRCAQRPAAALARPRAAGAGAVHLRHERDAERDDGRACHLRRRTARSRRDRLRTARRGDRGRRAAGHRGRRSAGGPVRPRVLLSSGSRSSAARSSLSRSRPGRGWPCWCSPSSACTPRSGRC